MLEPLRQRIADGDYASVCRLLGMEIEALESNSALVTLTVSPTMFNPFGTVHGGILCDLADMAMGTAFATTLAAGEGLATIELKINFLRPVSTGKLHAQARVVHRGRSTGLVECEIVNEQGKLVAKANSTCMVVTDGRATLFSEALTKK